MTYGSIDHYDFNDICFHYDEYGSLFYELQVGLANERYVIDQFYSHGLEIIRHNPLTDSGYRKAMKSDVDIVVKAGNKKVAIELKFFAVPYDVNNIAWINSHIVKRCSGYGRDIVKICTVNDITLFTEQSIGYLATHDILLLSLTDTIKLITDITNNNIDYSSYNKSNMSYNITNLLQAKVESIDFHSQIASYLTDLGLNPDG
jgi:hypothetical protein